MHKAIRQAARAFAVLILLLASTSEAPSPVEASPPPAATLVQNAPATCCFTNPGYAGTCEARPASGETCETILDYLNNPSSQGKSYCNGTNIRGGWRSVSCEAKR